MLRHLLANRINTDQQFDVNGLWESSLSFQNLTNVFPVCVHVCVWVLYWFILFLSLMREYLGSEPAAVARNEYLYVHLFCNIHHFWRINLCEPNCRPSCESNFKYWKLNRCACIVEQIKKWNSQLEQFQPSRRKFGGNFGFHSLSPPTIRSNPFVVWFFIGKFG